MQGQISDSELEIMKMIWENGGTALYAHIMEKLEQEGKEWKKNTVLTLLSRLMEKGYLRTSKIGRRNEYKALVKEGDYLKEQTGAFLKKLYEGSAKGLVSNLISQDLLTSEDLKELNAFWEEEKHD